MLEELLQLLEILHETGSVAEAGQEFACDRDGEYDLLAAANEIDCLGVVALEGRIGRGVEQNPHDQSSESMRSKSSSTRSMNSASSALQVPAR